MFKNPTYSIENFNYNKDEKLFVANEGELVVDGCHFPFPNQRKQFRIYNKRTGGFRRFRFVKEKDQKMIFTSEDGIMASIEKLIN